MNPTAEDILNKEAAEACLTPTQKQLVIAAMEEYASLSSNKTRDYLTEYYDKELTFWKLAIKEQQEETRQLRKEIEEYSLLKSKEAAEKAWEVGVSDGIIGLSELWNDDRFKVAKETLMKELFKPVTI